MKTKRIFYTIWILSLSLSWVLAESAPPAVHQAKAAQAMATQGTVIHVPGDVPNLQDAINQVVDGGIIEIAGGTYPSPAGGFNINNKQKSFTIRGAQGASVTLDGGGARPIVQIINSSLSSGGSITFDNLTFANGLSNTAGLAGGLTLVKAKATFNNCAFVNNHGLSSSNGAGGLFVADQSTAFFFDCLWDGNTSKTYGGGMGVEENSKAYLHHAQFLNNRTNLPGHSPTAAGGGIHVGNSTLQVTNSLFESNQAGYVGGGIYAIGTWTDPISTPRADVLVVNTEFKNNKAARDPGVSYPSPTEGGAFHAEDQTIARIYNSRFIENQSNTGGGVNLYRADVRIFKSIFLGNRATGTGSGNGFGAAISAISNDGVDPSTGNGAFNRPSAHLEVTDTLIQGRYGATTITGQVAGGFYAAGDSNRTYGLNGVPQMGGPAENRAVVIFDNVVLNDLDVQEIPNLGGTGHGGGFLVDHVDLTLQDSLVANSDALGVTNSSGGGGAVIRQSFAKIENSTIAHNSSEKFGGGVFVQGSTIDINGSNLIENTVYNTNFGAAVFSAPDDTYGFNVNGVVHNSLISNNSNTAIFDDDRTNGPINDIHYDNNTFYAGSVNAIVYDNPIWPFNDKTVAELNNLVVTRANGSSTDKSLIPNSALGSKPNVGMLLASPGHILPLNPPGGGGGSSPAYLGYAWSGSSASLDGSPLGSNLAGYSTTTSPGTHTLSVGGQTDSVQVTSAPSPDASFSLTSGPSTHTLSWSLLQGSYLDVAIDQGASVTPGPSGSTQVPSDPALAYSLYMVTEQGGVVKSIDTSQPELYAPSSLYVLAGLNIEENYGHLPIANLGGLTIDWTASASPVSLLELQNSSGQMQNSDTIVFLVTINGRPPGLYYGTIDVDGGPAGSKTVDVTVQIVDTLQQVFLPTTFR